MPRTVQQCTLFVVFGVFFLSDVVSCGSPPLRTPVIAMTTGFGMTTKATGTLNSMRTAEEQLFPSLDQVKRGSRLNLTPLTRSRNIFAVLCRVRQNCGPSAYGPLSAHAACESGGHRVWDAQTNADTGR